jgi:hypothetical protein
MVAATTQKKLIQACVVADKQTKILTWTARPIVTMGVRMTMVRTIQGFVDVELQTQTPMAI